MQENNQVLQDNDLPLDINSMIRALLKDWWMIVTAGLAGIMVAFLLTGVNYTPSYTSSMTFIVSSKGSTGKLSDQAAASSMTETFGQVLNSRLLKKKVQQELELGYLPGTIHTSVVEDTNLMTLRVSAPSAEQAYKILRSVLNNYPSITDHVLSNVVLTVLEAPEVPLEPSNPLSIKDIAVKSSLIGMAVMAIFLALLDYLRDDIKNVRDVGLKLDAKHLGTIYYETFNRKLKNRFKKVKKGLLISDPTRSFSFTENYKKLRTKVMYSLKRHNGKIVLVTSVMENEGKSIVASNLALALSHKSDKVVLIEGDLRKPSIHKIFEKSVDKTQELGEYLNKKIPIDGLLHYDKEIGMHFIVASRGYSNSTELLGSDRMQALLKEVRKKADYIIIDTPPTSLMADAEILAEYADASLLVVRQNMASAGSINDTIDMLENGHSDLIGCVYNSVKTGVFSGRGTLGSYYGGYHYRYRYRYRYKNYRYGHYGHYGHYGNYARYGAYGKYGQENGREFIKAERTAPVEELTLHEESV